MVSTQSLLQPAEPSPPAHSRDVLQFVAVLGQSAHTARTNFFQVIITLLFLFYKWHPLKNISEFLTGFLIFFKAFFLVRMKPVKGREQEVEFGVLRSNFPYEFYVHLFT